jgi:transposase-like protein
MAEKRSRCGFMAEFKAQAARRVLESGEPLSAVLAAELGLSTGRLSLIDKVSYKTIVL